MSDGQEVEHGTMIVTPAAAGPQLVRVSLPFLKGMLREGQTLIATDGQQRIVAALRVLTWHPDATPNLRWIFHSCHNDTTPVSYTHLRAHET